MISQKKRTRIARKESMQTEEVRKMSPGSIVIFVLYTCFSVYFDGRNFVFTDRSSYLLYTLLKLVQLALFFGLLSALERIRKTKRLNQRTRIAFVLFCLFGIGLIFIWPGNWVEVDEYSIYQYALVLKVHPNQGLFATALHILGLLFFFHPAMIVLFQCAMAAWIYSDIIVQCKMMTGNRTLPLYFLFFSPVALYYLYQPMRTFLFGALIILFLQKYILIWNDANCTYFKREVIQLTVLIAGVMCIRTEFRFMIFWYPVMLILLTIHKRVATVKSVVVALGIMILVLAGYSGVEKNSSGGGSPLALNFIMPVYTIFKDPKFDWEKNRAEVEAIDKVYAIDEILSKTNRGYTLAAPRNGYTEDEMKTFLRSSMTLIRRYPQDYMYCRWNEFVISVGFDTEAGFIQTTDNVKNWDQNSIPPKLRPFSEKIQSIASNFLGGQFTLAGIKLNFVFWALWLPIVITAELFLISLWEHRFEFSIALTVLLGELICTMLMAPVKYAMYYFAHYLGGWFIVYLYCAYRNTNKRLVVV